MHLSIVLCDPTHPPGFVLFLSCLLSFPIALPLQPLTMFHRKIQFWLLATRCLIVLFFPFNLFLPCAPAPCPRHIYITPLITTPWTVLRLLLLYLHCSSVSTAAVSHRDTCSIVPISLPCLKALLFQWFANPGTVTVDAESPEKLLLC